MVFLEEIHTKKDIIMCDNDHPRVWLSMSDEGYVICGYCNAKYIKILVDKSL
jgi:uncharacterized Zn-finger protein|tara:strand:- start:257 stop:412 length:156 start_codon:yes stop_codon:yes gene_type:complete